MSKFRQAEQVRQDFVANVSHELRTPLTAVRAAVDALIDGAGKADNRLFLGIIDRHTNRMDRLVSDLLRLARLDAGQETLSVVEFPADALFEAVETELLPLITERRIRITRRIAPLAAEITADQAKLHDVVKNLLENAIRYAPEASRVVLGTEPQDRAVLLTVRDRGPGIPSAELKRVFERFYRVEQSRSRDPDPGGTGLGLAIVKHLVGLHGGVVTAANRPRGGAVFTVRLPQPERPAAVPEPEEAPADVSPAAG